MIIGNNKKTVISKNMLLEKQEEIPKTKNNSLFLADNSKKPNDKTDQILCDKQCSFIESDKLKNKEENVVIVDDNDCIVSQQIYRFDIDDYYTKTESDNLFISINNKIDGLYIPSANYDTELGDLKMPDTVGGIPSGTTAQDLKGNSFTEMLDMLLFPTVNPQFINPFTKLLLTNVKSIVEVGDIIKPFMNISFNKGAITINGIKTQYRAGEALKWSVKIPNSPEILIESNSYQSPEFKFINRSIVNYYSNVYHDNGPQPLDNKGKPFGAPLPSGWIKSNVISIQSQWRRFWGTSSLSILDSNNILNIENKGSELSDNGLKTQTFNESPGQFKYWIVNSDLQQPTSFKDQSNNLPIPFEKGYNVNTVVNGISTMLTVYRSTNKLGGMMTIIIN